MTTGVTYKRMPRPLHKPIRWHWRGPVKAARLKLRLRAMARAAGTTSA